MFQIFKIVSGNLRFNQIVSYQYFHEQKNIKSNIIVSIGKKIQIEKYLKSILLIMTSI